MDDCKDPAVLFYTADFLADTTLWSYDELGRYIKLLCIQHLQGGVTEDDFLSVTDGNKRVTSKFALGDDGLYRNRRMTAEAEKRKRYSESRRKNRQTSTDKKTSVKHMKNICKSYEGHMENENVNENINEDININTIKKHKYGSYMNVLLSDDDYEKLKVEFPTDYNDRIERLSEYIASSGKKYKSHLATIRAWARKEKEKDENNKGHTELPRLPGVIYLE